MSGATEQDIRIRQQQGVSKLAVPFASGWANLAGFEAATYSKHGRTVQLQGIVTKTGGTPAAGNVIFTLPQNFRPSATLVFCVLTNGTTVGRLDILANGDVVWQAGASAETDNTSLSGISFVV